jgi:hypothetical protein
LRGPLRVLRHDQFDGERAQERIQRNLGETALAARTKELVDVPGCHQSDVVEGFVAQPQCNLTLAQHGDEFIMAHCFA